MTSDAHDTDREHEDPAPEQLQRPSTEKPPGEEPKGGADQPEPSHAAVGIGVIGQPQVDPQGADAEEESS